MCLTGMATSERTRILILGGGFGRVHTAINLERLLRRELREGRVEIGLVNRENYTVFQPMLPEVISQCRLQRHPRPPCGCSIRSAHNDAERR